MAGVPSMWSSVSRSARSHSLPDSRFSQWLLCPSGSHEFSARQSIAASPLWISSASHRNWKDTAGLARACQAAGRVRGLPRRVMYRRPGQRLEPGGTLVGQPLRAVEHFDAVGLAAGVDGGQTALLAVAAPHLAVPALRRVAAHVGLRRQCGCQRCRVPHAVVVSKYAGWPAGAGRRRRKPAR